MNKESHLLKFTKLCIGLSRQEIPAYRTKFSKHTFTQPQHLVLACLKVKLRLYLPGTCGWAWEDASYKGSPGIEEGSYFTTVQKAFSRLSMLIWRILLKASISFLARGEIAAMSCLRIWTPLCQSFLYEENKAKNSAIKVTLLGEMRSLGFSTFTLPLLGSMIPR